MHKSGLAVLEAWTKAINQRAVEPLLNLYSEGAVVLPTFAAKIADEPGAIRAYFEDLASRSEFGVKLDEDSFRETRIGYLSVICGLYAFTLGEGKDTKFWASRFTFVLDLSQESPILHHHSSALPKASN
ncbi:MAG: hypothetical protein ACYTG5_14520 [Planctomycetota bacterium]|jgi:hypothetical protein